MNDKTIKLLEFDKIRQDVAALALSEEAARIILEEEPFKSQEETEKLKAFAAEVQKRIALLERENPQTLPDITPVIKKLEVEGMVFEIAEVYALGIFIQRSEIFRQWLLKPLCDGPVLQPNPVAEIAGDIPSCSDITSEIFKIIDKEGKFRDLPAIRDIRKRIRLLQKDIESIGSRYANDEDKKRMLQSELPSQRDGRLVLAVKANFRGRIRGIVHEVSATGQTIFVEPEEVVEKNNELLIENRRLEAEIRRILMELTGRIACHAEKLKIFHASIIYLETIRARASYGFERNGFFASLPPEVNASGVKLNLKKARHPLLGKNAQPLDLFMAEGIRTIIITGPNTGGKTVAIKTLGLLSMMNQFGLALPVEEGSVLPVFDGIYADIGDEQSISQSLSTFSGHMTNIADILSRITPRSLVLLDELGSGTDPEEGSAIAMAILDYFIEKKIHLVVTTHHGILKNYGYTREGVENASMEFDSKTLSPTYKIIVGIPGESRALDIASRNGFPAELVNKARSYLDEERSDVSALIKGLKEKHMELDAAVTAGKQEEQRLMEERRRSDLKELRLKQKELLLKSEGAGDLKKLLGESRKTLENLVRELNESAYQDGVSREMTLKVKDFLSGLEAQVRDEEAALNRESLALAEERRRFEENEGGKTGAEISGGKSLEPGMEVFARPQAASSDPTGAGGEQRRRGRLVRLDKKATAESPATWIVEVGSLKMSFAESELTHVEADSARSGGAKNGGAKNGGTQTNKSPLWAADLAPSSPVQIELNLLGMRLSEALAALGRQLDAAILGGLREFAVVHGKGDGILCKGVHDFLKGDLRVADYYFSRPELGGFGRTEVILK